MNFEAWKTPCAAPGCDIIVITASTFVNRTFHLYQPHIDPKAEVYIMGPSTPLSRELGERRKGRVRDSGA